MRDGGLLEVALYRPQTGYYRDLVEEAAALWESIAQNHPFIDGNKRAAFAVIYTLLAINGINFEADSSKTFSFIDGLYRTHSFSSAYLAAWLRANTKLA